MKLSDLFDYEEDEYSYPYDYDPEAQLNPPDHWIPVCMICGTRWRDGEGFVEVHSFPCANDRYGWNFVFYVDPAKRKEQEA